MSTVWYRQTFNAFKQECAMLRYDITEVFDENIDFGTQKRIVIIIGTSNEWVSDILRRFSSRHIHSIVVSCQPLEPYENTSYIIIDHVQAMTRCMELLHSNGRDRVALYGLNMDSHADRTKKRCFLEYGMPESGIYYLTGISHEKCYERFKADISNYNAIICANDITAAALISHISEDGFINDDSPCIISFGNSLIGQLLRIPLITVTLDHEELGIQSVHLYSYLTKNAHDAAITVKIPCRLMYKASEVPVSETVELYHRNYSESTFYQDDELKEVMSIENTLQKCDNTDLAIIRGILNGKAYPSIADDVYLTVNAVKYRIKRLFTLSGIDSREKFKAVLSKYIDTI